MATDIFSEPKALKFLASIELKRTLLHESHITALTQYVDELTANAPDNMYYPYFDPHDGGQQADILFLMEKPSKDTITHFGGSGFISRDNKDRTAPAIFNFMNQAGIPRQRTILWNIVPGWNETRKCTSAEVKAGSLELNNVLALLPNVKTIVLIGKKAASILTQLDHPPYKVFVSAHPGPQVYGRFPDKWNEIPLIWAKAL